MPPPVLTVLSIAAIGLSGRLVPSIESSSIFYTCAASLCSGVGIGFLIWAGVLFEKEKTTVNPFRPNKTASIVDSGPYRFTRNPMYLGMILLIIGSGFWFQQWTSILVVIAFWFYMNETQIKPEERALTEKFEEEYVDYMSKVRRWI